ncbi:MAG: hypothetical protein KJ941_06500, partial [Bacteroidetes bacterium]|nr:hypothetical protein [Bacteroidota bacterium]
MRNLKIIGILYFLLSSLAFGQDLIQTDGNFQRCSGTLYDENGTANYRNNRNITTTICPSTPGASMFLEFTTFQLENGFDYLYIYDGVNTGAPLLATLTGTLGPFNIQANNPSGCLTLRFTSDGTGRDVGFVANMSCVFPCQTVIASIGSSSKPVVNGFIDICLGEIINLVAGSSYPNNNTNYAQSDATSTFSWDFGNGVVQSGQSVSQSFGLPGVYDLDLNITDINKCKNTNDIQIRIRVSDIPTFNGTGKQHDEICLDDANVLTGAVQPKEIELFCNQESPGLTFLPDGSGTSYTTKVSLDCFNPGATLANMNDLTKVCIDMEHSYLLDIDITLTCPNGSTIDLYFPSLTGNDEVFLGEPVDNDALMTPGN